MSLRGTNQSHYIVPKFSIMSYDPHAEKKIALQAERILQNALRAKIGSLGFKQHVSGDGKKRMSDAVGRADYKLGKAKDDGLRYYMNKLSMVMEKHGYIQNYGDSGVRQGSTRTRTRPKNTTYSFKTHVWKLPPQDFIEQAIRQSGVIEYVLDNVSAVRGEDIIHNLLNFFDGKKY